jgi:RNase P protein component
LITHAVKLSKAHNFVRGKDVVLGHPEEKKIKNKKVEQHLSHGFQKTKDVKMVVFRCTQA